MLQLDISHHVHFSACSVLCRRWRYSLAAPTRYAFTWPLLGTRWLGTPCTGQVACPWWVGGWLAWQLLDGSSCLLTAAATC